MKATPETYRQFQQLILRSEGVEFKIGGFRVIPDPSLKEDEWRFAHRDLDSSVINLERVLRALGEAYDVDGNGQICKGYHRNHIAIWTLTLPAHEQEEETLNSLIEILK